MSTRTSYNNAIPHFVADPGSTIKIPGRNVKWSAVDEDDFDPEGTGSKRIPAGTIMVEFADGEIAPQGSTDATASPDESPTDVVGLLASDAQENSDSDSLSGYGVYKGGVVFENLLPDASGGPPKVLSNGEKTALTDGGCQFIFETYVDSRAD